MFLVITMMIFSTTISISAEEAPSAEASDQTQEETLKNEGSNTDADSIADKITEKLSPSLAELIDSWKETDKENATFSDRILEFFTPENIVDTVSMLFMLVVGCIVYVMRRKQGVSIRSTNNDLIVLKKSIDETISNDNQIENSVKDLSDTINQIIDYLKDLEAKIDAKDNSADKARDASIGVATMLNHIFNNSKTIDQAGKKIMNIDYLKAIGEKIDCLQEEESKKEEE